MRNSQLTLSSLLMMLLVVLTITSCQKEELVTPTVSEDIIEETNMLAVVAPTGLSEDEAIEWAEKLSDEEFELLSQEAPDDVVESRWCTAYAYDGQYVDTAGCNCYVDGLGYGPWCVKICDIYVRHCGGWSGGNYVVIKYTQYRNCNC